MKVIVAISDMQVPYHDKRAVKNLIEFVKDFKPTEVITVGDEMDMQTISRWSAGTSLEHEGSIGQDRDETCRILEQLNVSHMARSNHTDRLLNTVSMRAPGLFGLPELNIQNFFRMKELGIKYHEDPYELAPDWLLMHGDEGNASSTAGVTALNLAKRSNMSVICGHTHRQGLVPYSQSHGAGTTRTIWGFETGNLMDYSKAKYIKGGLFNWQQGFGVLYVDGQKVTPVAVPIQKDGSFIFAGYKWG